MLKSSRPCAANEPVLTSIRNIADRLINLSATIGSIALIAEIIIIIIDVVGRTIGAPLFGSQDLITMTMVFVVFGGMAICDRQGGHINIDMLERLFPSALNKFTDIFSAVLGAVIFMAIAWTVYESAKLSLMLNLSTNLLQLSKAYFQWALCGFALMTAAGMLLRAIELILSGRDVRAEPVAK